MKKTIIALGHVLFWLISFYLITRIFGVSTVEIIEEENKNGIQEKILITYDNQFTFATAITLGLAVIAFYTHIFVLLRNYFVDKKIVPYLSKLLLLLSLAVLLTVILNRTFNYTNIGREVGYVFPFFALHMALLVFYTALSFAYAFINEWFKNEKLRNIIAQEKLSTELSFLKAQINPHFLFNTLNNLFSISQKHNVPELSKGISELSNLMRYMLYESNSAFVSLTKEVEYIESFIEIQKLRYEEQDFIINFNKKGSLNSVKIAPLILLPFIENAFKHGFSLDENAFITIDLEVSDGNINFIIKNKIFRNQNIAESASGIGLENVKRRLELIYPSSHSLEIRKKENRFIVELKIYQ